MTRYEGTRMFHLVTRTWNVVTGCNHNCIYCWARNLVEKRLKRISVKYRAGFVPMLHEKELRKSFRPNELVFVCDMGDLFGDWVPREWIAKVVDVVRRYPRTTFLFLTKNPRRYVEMLDLFRGLSNVILGATIETDDDELYMEYGISRAPLPRSRGTEMYALDWDRKMVSIEPILDFSSPTEFADMIADIEPEFVYVGYDNYGNRLPEPSLDKTLELIDILRSYGITVYEKTLRRAWWER